MKSDFETKLQFHTTQSGSLAPVAVDKARLPAQLLRVIPVLGFLACSRVSASSFSQKAVSTGVLALNWLPQIIILGGILGWKWYFGKAKKSKTPFVKKEFSKKKQSDTTLNTNNANESASLPSVPVYQTESMEKQRADDTQVQNKNPFAKIVTAPKESLLDPSPGYGANRQSVRQESLSDDSPRSFPPLPPLSSLPDQAQSKQILYEPPHQIASPPPSSSSTSPSNDKSFMTKLFSKSPPGGRPIDWKSAFSTAKTALSYRQAIAAVLYDYLPEDLRKEFRNSFSALVQREELNKRESVNEIVSFLLEEQRSNLREEQSNINGLKIFAEVTNSFIVRLVDRAALFLKDDKSSGEDVVSALEELVSFIDRVGLLFDALDVEKESDQLEPIKYNGKMERRFILSLFRVYLTFITEYSMENNNQPNDLFFLQMQAKSEPRGGDQEDHSRRQQIIQEKIEFHQDRLDKLQFLFSVGSEERISMEQEISNELLMKQFGGDSIGEGGNPLSSLIGGLGLGGTQAKNPLLKALQGLTGRRKGSEASFPDFSQMMNPGQEKEFADLFGNLVTKEKKKENGNKE
jgi:hypothetical protein